MGLRTLLGLKRRGAAKAADGATSSLRIHGGDAFFSLAKAALNNSDRLIAALTENEAPLFDLVLAHEIRISGLAGLRAAEQFGADRRILDNVEYPHLAGRSSPAVAKVAQADPLGAKLLSAWLAEVANNYDRVLATSQGQCDALREIGVRTPIDLLRNARLFQPDVSSTEIRDRCGCLGGDVLLLHCGNIHAQSGAEQAVRALAILPPQFRLCFLGQIRHDEDELRELASAPDLAHRITFLDPVPPGELIRLSAGADLSIIPLLPDTLNHQHCLPNRVFESIAARNPIVAPSMIELGRFVAENGIGVTFDSFEPESMGRAIQLADAKRRSCQFQAPLSAAAQKFSWEREQRPLSDIAGAGAGRSALLAACKIIERNDRVYRQTKTLMNLGYQVTVAANSMPMLELRHRDVRYILLPR